VGEPNGTANLIAKNGFPAPNKEPATTKTDCLTGKAPYKFECTSLQRAEALLFRDVQLLVCKRRFMASLQHSELVSVIQRNSGQMQALLAALREKNSSNGILR
jgi:hypothetical protein